MFCRQRLGVFSKQEELACSAGNDLVYGVGEVGVWWLGRGCATGYASRVVVHMQPTASLRSQRM